MAMPRAGPFTRLAKIGDRAGRRLRQAGDDAQQRGFAGAGAAEQPNNLAFAQAELHVVEHQQFRAAGPGKSAPHIANIEEGRRVQWRPLQVRR